MKGYITKNFRWEEMIESHTAKERGISNYPGTCEMVAIEKLVKELLQPLRELYGMPIRISSGYRCQELNRLVGGAPSSQHLKGEAVDCVVKNATTLLNTLKNSPLTFDQAILYHKRNFLHLSLCSEGQNRLQILFR